MKKIFILFSIMTLLAVACCPKANAQGYTNEKITVNTADLTVDQLAKIKLEQANADLQKKLETYGKWVGVGGEIGNAVKEGLNAVVDVSDKFGKTDVGKFTLIMVAWKVMGKDVVRIVLGLLFVLLSEFILYKSMRRLLFSRKVCVESNGWQFWKPKKYQIIEASFEGEGLGFMWFLHIAGVLGTIGLAYAIMFA